MTGGYHGPPAAVSEMPWATSYVIHHPKKGAKRDPAVCMHSRPVQAFPVNNEFFQGRVVCVHRPTHCPSLEPEWDPFFTQHFQGRKRLWEIRIQGRFKEVVDVPLRWAFVHDFASVPSYTLGLVESVLLSFFGAAMGFGKSELYVSHGQTADEVQQGEEPELSHVAAGLLCFDQTIVTPPGCKVPDILGDMQGQGMSRVDSVRKYKEYLNSLVMTPENTYTFALWGPSQFVDVIKWQIQKVLPTPISLDVLCGPNPVHMQLYALPKDHKDGERHLTSKKNIFVDILIGANAAPIPESVRQEYNLVSAQVVCPDGFEDAREDEDEEMAARLIQAEYVCRLDTARSLQEDQVALLPLAPLDFWGEFVLVPLVALGSVSMATELERLQAIEVVLDCLKDQVVHMASMEILTESGELCSLIQDSPSNEAGRQLVSLRASLHAVQKQTIAGRQPSAYTSAGQSIRASLDYIRNSLQRGSWPGSRKGGSGIASAVRDRVIKKQRMLVVAQRTVPDILLSADVQGKRKDLLNASMMALANIQPASRERPYGCFDSVCVVS
mmetsp:Transcript_42700/g.97202  ORF Transcript_42700/g.97202 Transcript_42700/m.97202 type:complete len:553 (-) Transcript_42700:145-1803(-)